ncbi:hypothetical protein [Companilactobacillus versmoldensis]|uniref:Uncharacterized protein n=1 Tax=Companilactobacillus versmoldensis DSM 14857 = KCTC 3814 TaxID=1423815 RepID=A0A0R1SFD9_9LACO|nr:hypothetical protein [Companilactobacillus versmoldensis]KRL68109.1 hypothetical protein FC27_GL000846 [Companilactobacillus versmoldensis DSM 14857 = KCTC 3814]
MKYKLKLDYTEEELKELKELGKYYFSPMEAIQDILNVGIGNDPFENLRAKYFAMGHEDEFDFMADINNVVMGTAIFPENKYVVHDSVTGQYIYYNIKQKGLRWGKPHSGTGAETKTKEEWLAINPAYEPMLERVEE